MARVRARVHFIIRYAFVVYNLLVRVEKMAAHRLDICQSQTAMAAFQIRNFDLQRARVTF